MKKIKLIRLLLPITLIVWAIIMYRVFAVVTDSTNTTNVKEHRKPTKEKLTIQEDTFALLVNYPDPFLANNKNLRRKAHSNTMSRRKNLSQKKKEPAWPKITYLGVLQNKSNGKYSANLIINGKNVILSKGKESFGVHLTKVCFDSVQLVYEKHTKTIKMQN